MKVEAVIILTLNQVMSNNVYSLRKNDTLQDARLLMLARHIHHVPIVDKNDHILGLVSQRDILSASNSERSDLNEDQIKEQNNIRLKEVMTTEVRCMDVNDALLDAAQHLLENRHGCIPVIENDVLVGMITSFDFIKIAADQLT